MNKNDSIISVIRSINSPDLSDSKEWFEGNSLHHAVEKNQVEVVKLCLNRGIHINVRNKDGMTPLHIACKKNHPEMVVTLLKSGANVNSTTYLTIKQDICEGFTPLHYAVIKGSQQITKLLLKRNAVVDIKALYGTPLHIAAVKGFQQIVSELLDYGSAINSECMPMAYTPLHFASANGKKKVVRLLLSNGANVNAVTKANQTPLYVATERGHHATVKLLLEYGADVDTHNKDGNSTLYCAVKKGHSDVIKELLKFCPDINNESNQNSLRLAIYLAGNKYRDILTRDKYRNILKDLFKYGFVLNFEDINNWKLLWRSIRYGYTKIVEVLLTYGANVNMRFECEEHTPLHIATIYEKKRTVKLLIKHGANVNAKDADGKTPICYAVKNNYLKIAKLLLSNGAKIKDYPDLLIAAVRTVSVNMVKILLKSESDIDINYRNSSGRTALNYTALVYRDSFKVNGSIARLLLANGASADIRSENGTTVLHTAIEKGCAEVVEALVDYNVDVNLFVYRVSPLHISAEKGNKSIVRTLLQHGAIVNAKRRDGKTALCIAVEEGRSSIVKLLLVYRAEVNCRNDADMTLLHLATLRHNEEIIDILIEFGVNVDSINAYGQTPLIIAFREMRRNIMVALLQGGCDINVRGAKDARGHDLPCISALLQQFNARCNDYNSTNMKIVVRHIAQLKAKKSFVNETYMEAINANLNIKQYYINCEAEIKKMKKKKIANTIVSFYDILTKNKHQVATYAANENIVKVFESEEYTEIFPIYGDLLENRFEKGEKRLRLLQRSIKSFNALIGIQLPDVFTNVMFSYLNKFDMKSLIYACPYEISHET